MKTGFLVVRRDGDGKGQARIGTVRLVEDDAVVVEWREGDRTRHALPMPPDIAVVPPGSLRYRALADADRLKGEFARSPEAVLAAILDEVGGEASMSDLADEARALGLAAEHNSTWWLRMHKRLLAQPHVMGIKGTKKVKLVPGLEDQYAKERRFPAREALAALVVPSTKCPKELRQALQAAVRSGLSDLTPYELLAAKTHGVTLRSWPEAPRGYAAQGTSERVLAAAVEFLSTATKGQRRPNRPVAAPTPTLTKSGAPPAEEILPLVIGLVTMPEDSAAADLAATFPRGTDAQACVSVIAERFEDVHGTAGAHHLLSRVAVVLPAALDEQPLLTAEQRDVFAEELALRVIDTALLVPAGQYKPSDLVEKWVDLVLGHDSMPAPVLGRALSVRGAYEVAAALESFGNNADGGRARVARLLTLPVALDDTPEASPPLSDPAEEEAQVLTEAPPTASEPGVDEANEVTDAPTTLLEPVGNVAAESIEAPSAPSGSVSDAAQESTEAPPTPPDAVGDKVTELIETLADERELRAKESEDHEAALDRERAKVRDLQTANEQLQRGVSAYERQLAEAAELHGELEAQRDTTAAELAAAVRRVEALTRRGQRRDEELRLARQAVRGASQAQLRQARLDAMRVLAAVVAEVADQAVHEANASGPAHALYRRVLAQAAAAGLVDVGVPGEEVDFDTLRHQAPTGAAARVVVERPAFSWRGDGADTEEIVLAPALVRQVEP